MIIYQLSLKFKFRFAQRAQTLQHVLLSFYEDSIPISGVSAEEFFFEIRQRETHLLHEYEEMID